MSRRTTRLPYELLAITWLVGLILAVVNPASGPGAQADPNYVDFLRKAREANWKVIG